MASDVTLLDIAATVKEPVTSQVLLGAFEGQLPSPVDFYPTRKVDQLSMKTVRVTDPDAPTTRAIGGSAGSYKAKVSDRTESLKVIQDKVTFDVVFLKQKGYIEDPIDLQFRIYGESLKHELNNLIVNGDPGADETEPEGLQYLADNDAMFSGQGVDAGGLDVDANDANRNTWLDRIDEAMELSGGGAPDICILNRQSYRKFRSALRNLKLYDTTQDQFDRRVMMYENTKFVDAGQTPAGMLSPSGTQVLLDDGYTDIFGNSSASIMFFVSFKGEMGAKIAHLGPPENERLGINPNDPAQYVVSMTYCPGFSYPIRFAFSTLQGLDVS